MRLKVFQSDKGDCLLLTSNDGKRMLADGGMRSSYREHVAPAMGQLQHAREQLDLLYVSHIDRDHISGVLQLLDDLLEWRIYDFQQKSGNEKFPQPKQPRPPDPLRLWHNAFHDQVGKNVGEIEQMLAASASVLEASLAKTLLAEAQSQRELATSVPEGLELSRRASPEQLNIPVNKEFGGELILVHKDGKRNTVKLGSLRLTVIGPFENELKQLRKEWNTWLRDHGKALDDLRRQMSEDAERLEAGEVQRFRAALALRAGELGDISKVTAPNLASLMLLVEEDAKTVLMTGDGHADHITAGLKAAGRLDDGGIHVDVLKVQHHGAEYNITPDFCKQVTADDYVFCGNGGHDNPDLRAVETIIDSRLGPPARRSENPGAERAFKLWFNSSLKVPGEKRNQSHMREVEKLVAARAKKSKGRLRYSFLSAHSFEIQV
jgi:beta-lactamase superfamily II metal-dependent hydrolase